MPSSAPENSVCYSTGSRNSHNVGSLSREYVLAAESGPPSTVRASRLLALTTIAEEKIVPLSREQLYRVAKRSDGPFRQVEGRWMAYEDELHAWVREHPTGAGESAGPPVRGGGLADRVRELREDAGG